MARRLRLRGGPRWGAWWLALALPACLLVACYQVPTVPVDKPLACTPSQPQCPAGYGCVGERVCAPKACVTDSDCPTGAGLVCEGSRGCNLPSKVVADGGATDGAAADTGSPDAVSDGAADDAQGGG